MSINNMPTIYELVDEVCARDFEILARLSTNQRNKFVDIIYSDILEGDSPEETTEDAIYDYVQEFITKAISVSIDDVVDFNL
jgi:hypothetical protein